MVSAWVIFLNIVSVLSYRSHIDDNIVEDGDEDVVDEYYNNKYYDDEYDDDKYYDDWSDIIDQELYEEDLELAYLNEYLTEYAQDEMMTESAAGIPSECRMMPAEGHRWCLSGNAPKGDYYYWNGKNCDKSFYYYGCGGNNNRFKKKADCLKKCDPQLFLPACEQPLEKGKKTGCRDGMGGTKNRVYYNKKDDTCRRFDYEGCGGNKNNFQNYMQCEHKCRKKSAELLVKDPKCLIQPKKGSGSSVRQRYYFDRKTLTCKTFEYSGKVEFPKDENNFPRRAWCMKTCGVREPGESGQAQFNRWADRICACPTDDGDDCLNSNGRRIPQPIHMGRYWAWNFALRKCESFWYKGCGGNKNRFKTSGECYGTCRGRGNQNFQVQC